MTLRLCEPITLGMVAIRVSNFGSLHSAYGLAKENKGYIFNVKTAHSMLPKKQIEEQLKGCAAGSSVVCRKTEYSKRRVSAETMNTMTLLRVAYNDMYTSPY